MRSPLVEDRLAHVLTGCFALDAIYSTLVGVRSNPELGALRVHRNERQKGVEEAVLLAIGVEGLRARAWQ